MSLRNGTLYSVDSVSFFGVEQFYEDVGSLFFFIVHGHGYHPGCLS